MALALTYKANTLHQRICDSMHLYNTLVSWDTHNNTWKFNTTEGNKVPHCWKKALFAKLFLLIFSVLGLICIIKYSPTFNRLKALPPLLVISLIQVSIIVDFLLLVYGKDMVFCSNWIQSQVFRMSSSATNELKPVATFVLALTAPMNYIAGIFSLLVVMSNKDPLYAVTEFLVKMYPYFNSCYVFVISKVSRLIIIFT